MSTKTTFKRIALVAVASMGFGVMSAVPSTAADAYTASFTAPSSQAIQTVSLTDGSVTARDLGTVVTTLVTGVGDALKPGTDTVTVTIDAQTGATQAAQDKNDALKAKLTFGVQSSAVTPLTPAATASASNDYNFASTGQNVLNNAIVSTSGRTMLTSPSSAAFTSAIGRAYVKLGALTAAEATAASGGTVTFAMTLVGGGKISTFTQTMTITFGTRLAGVATVPTTTGTITAGGTATFAYTAPYTAVRASDAWTDETFTLGGTATGQTFSVTGVATGGSVTLVRTSATVIEGRVVKSNIAGTLSTVYTIVVTAPATATAGQTVTVATSAGTWSVTVQPYTPAYASSEVSLAVAANGYYAATGDAILWGDARVASGKSADVTVTQKDQTGATITQPAFAKTVTATITGRGSLDAASGADVVVKSKTWSVTNSQLTSGTTAITVFPDGVSGEGTLAISVDGVAIKSYTMRFFGDATSVTATLLRPVGSNVTSATNGVDGSATNADAIAGITTKSVTATTAPAIAVVVKDANGYAIPSAAPIATSSNLAVVSGATRLFVDSGISDLTALKVSAGTFVQHYSYTTVANSASGSSSSLTFNFINRAGTSLASTPVVVKVGGEVAKTVVTFNKASYAPGEAATITFTSTDAAGNPAFDGQDVLVGGLKSTLAFTGAPTTAKIVGGSDTENVYAPASPGAWTITDVTGKAFTATATVTNVAAEAKAAADAATAAAKAAGDAATAAAKAAGDAATAAANAAGETAQAATDAAAEATDAANAATDAANAAAEAADAATAAAQDAADAVAALSTQVSEMVNALKKQITALTNLVIKIQKKVKA